MKIKLPKYTKKYKLINSYNGSPPLGTELVDYKNSLGETIFYIESCLGVIYGEEVKIVENFPLYWELIEDFTDKKDN